MLCAKKLRPSATSNSEDESSRTMKTQAAYQKYTVENSHKAFHSIATECCAEVKMSESLHGAE